MATYKSKYTGTQIDEAIGLAFGVPEELDALREDVEEALAGGVGTSTDVVEGITVLSSSWLDETDTTALWRCRIENAEIEENTIVNVHFSVTDYNETMPASLVRATNAGVLAVTTSGVGYVDIYATNQPDTDLNCVLELTGYRVVE